MKLPIEVANYRLVEEVGSGSFGNVYRAEVRGEFGFQQDVAVKLVDPVRASARPDLITSLADEGLLLSQIQHPNIVRVRQLTKGHQEILGDVFLLVMELVRGPRLKEVSRILLTAGVLMPLEAVIFLLTDAADALHYAHTMKTSSGRALGLVHRDLKPENLMLDETGRLKILDFGIAWASERRVESTETGMTKGTVLFMSPEQLRGDPLDGRSDIYSLGLVAWELICGEHMVPLPRRGLADIPGVILNMDRTRVEERLHRLRAALKSETGYALDDHRASLLEDLFVRMLAQDPAGRFDDAGALLAHLEELGETWRPRLGRHYLRKVSEILARASLPDSGETVADANPKVSSDEIELVTMHTRAFLAGAPREDDSLARGDGYSPFAPTVADAPIGEEGPDSIEIAAAAPEEASVGDDLVPMQDPGPDFDPEATPVITRRPGGGARRSSGRVAEVQPLGPPDPTPAAAAALAVTRALPSTPLTGEPPLLEDSRPTELVRTSRLPASVEQSVVGATRLVASPKKGPAHRLGHRAREAFQWLQDVHPVLLLGFGGVWLGACLLLVWVALLPPPRADVPVVEEPQTPKVVEGADAPELPIEDDAVALDPTVTNDPPVEFEPIDAGLLSTGPAEVDEVLEPAGSPDLADDPPVEELAAEPPAEATATPTPTPVRRWSPRISRHDPPAWYLLDNPVDFKFKATDCQPQLYVAPMNGRYQKVRTASRGGMRQGRFTPPYDEAWLDGVRYYIDCCKGGKCKAAFGSKSKPQVIPRKG